MITLNSYNSTDWKHLRPVSRAMILECQCIVPWNSGSLLAIHGGIPRGTDGDSRNVQTWVTTTGHGLLTAAQNVGFHHLTPPMVPPFVKSITITLSYPQSSNIRCNIAERCKSLIIKDFGLQKSIEKVLNFKKTQLWWKIMWKLKNIIRLVEF